KPLRRSRRESTSEDALGTMGFREYSTRLRVCFSDGPGTIPTKRRKLWTRILSLLSQVSFAGGTCLLLRTWTLVIQTPSSYCPSVQGLRLTVGNENSSLLNRPYCSSDGSLHAGQPRDAEINSS